MEVTELKRVFKHGDNILEDPNREMSSDDVLEFYGNQFTELTNAHVTGPTVIEDKLQYEFSTSVGTKG
jgi:PRTRC genetic system protein C